MENEGIGIGGHIDVTLRHGKKHEGESDFLDYREAFFMDDNVPETYIGSDSEDDRMVTVIDEVPPHEAVEAINFGNEPVKLRPKKERGVQEFGTCRFVYLDLVHIPQLLKLSDIMCNCSVCLLKQVSILAAIQFNVDLL